MNNQNDESVANTSTEKPIQHKWPIRPGVHVHVNGLHTLNNSGNAPTTGGTGPTTVPAEKITGFSYGARNSNSGSGSSAGSSTANCDEISNAGSSECFKECSEDMVANMNHKEVMTRGTSTERNVPPPSENRDTCTSQFSDTNQSNSNLGQYNNTKAMQGKRGLITSMFFFVFAMFFGLNLLQQCYLFYTFSSHITEKYTKFRYIYQQ